MQQTVLLQGEVPVGWFGRSRGIRIPHFHTLQCVEQRLRDELVDKSLRIGRIKGNKMAMLSEFSTPPEF